MVVPTEDEVGAQREERALVCRVRRTREEQEREDRGGDGENADITN